MKLLKISFLLFFIIPIAIIANNGYSSIDYLDIDSYEVEPEEPEFESNFSSESNQKNFKKLREFLNEKRDLENSISGEIDNFRYYKFGIRIGDYGKIISNLKRMVKKDNVQLDIDKHEKYFVDLDYNEWVYEDDVWDEEEYELVNVSKGDIQKRITLLESRIVKCKKIEQTLSDNFKNVRSDISNCESQIDYALRPEYKRQEFRTNISGYFSLLIGLLLGAFFLVVYLKSNNNLSSHLLSGNGLQFITLFVLIIAIILFGILGILEGRELAAILSGISGYILGKGITPLSTTVPPTTVPLPPSTT
ncbi:MAG: hypothetical protein ACI976_001272 [Aureispira sp.]|jgi:hypothetical protein